MAQILAADELLLARAGDDVVALDALTFEERWVSQASTVPLAFQRVRPRVIRGGPGVAESERIAELERREELRKLEEQAMAAGEPSPSELADQAEAEAAEATPED